MIDHISLRVNDFDKALTFYKAALAPLGYKVMMQFPGAVGLGDKKPDFWLSKSDKSSNPTHIAFSADRKAINAFHAAALAAGGTDNGAPGLRADYHPNYYGAFVLDPEGNNIEAVSHDPEKKAAKKSAKKAAKKAAKPAKKAAKKAAKPAKKAAKKAAKPAKKAAKKAAKPAKKAAKPAKKAAKKAAPKAKAKAKKK